MGSNVRNATQLLVSRRDEVLDIMARGTANRKTASTNMNDRSSRSHVVMTVLAVGTSKVRPSAISGDSLSIALPTSPRCQNVINAFALQ